MIEFDSGEKWMAKERELRERNPIPKEDFDLYYTDRNNGKMKIRKASSLEGVSLIFDDGSVLTNYGPASGGSVGATFYKDYESWKNSNLGNDI